MDAIDDGDDARTASDRTVFAKLAHDPGHMGALHADHFRHEVVGHGQGSDAECALVCSSASVDSFSAEPPICITPRM